MSDLEKTTIIRVCYLLTTKLTKRQISWDSAKSLHEQSRLEATTHEYLVWSLDQEAAGEREKDNGERMPTEGQSKKKYRRRALESIMLISRGFPITHVWANPERNHVPNGLVSYPYIFVPRLFGAFLVLFVLSHRAFLAFGFSPTVTRRETRHVSLPRCHCCLAKDSETRDFSATLYIDVK